MYWLLSWKGGVLTGWSLQGGLPEGALFQPTSEREFSFRGLEDESGTAWKLVFEPAGSGKVRGLRLTGGRIDLTASRPR